MQFNYNHQYWMQQLLVIARRAEPSKAIPYEFTARLPNYYASRNDIPISALIVKNNEIIAIAVNKIEEHQDATNHAETLAIKEASKVLGNWRLNDCILYTTLEPCSMCAGAILNSRISKVVFGAYDLNYGACGSKFNLFKLLGKEGQVEVIGGILEIECSRLLKDFFLAKR